MDHPLISDRQASLRRRVIQFFRAGYKIRRTSNIVFVCGGNDDTHMRSLFRRFCESNLTDYEIFLPEAAIGDVLIGDGEPFDIADFETLVGELAHAIVVFPEAPGSYAETGYFSAVEALASKCILSLDFRRQRDDSFISMGPAKKISEKSRFYPLIQMDYENPDFSVVCERIRRIDRYKNKKTLTINDFSSLSAFDISCIVFEIVNICTIATYEDVVYIMRGLFKGVVQPLKILKIMSIISGAGYLARVGEFGHFTVNKNKESLLEVKEGFREQFDELRLSLADVYLDQEVDFVRLVEEARNVG